MLCFIYQIKSNYPNIYIYRVVFNGGSNGAIFRYPLLIDFSSFGSKRDSGPHRRAVEERCVTDATIYTARHRFMVVKNDPFPSSTCPGRSIRSRGMSKFSSGFRAVNTFSHHDCSGVKGSTLVPSMS